MVQGVVFEDNRRIRQGRALHYDKEAFVSIQGLRIPGSGGSTMRSCMRYCKRL